MYNHDMKRRTISIEDEVWETAIASGNASRFITESILMREQTENASAAASLLAAIDPQTLAFWEGESSRAATQSWSGGNDQ